MSPNSICSRNYDSTCFLLLFEVPAVGPVSGRASSRPSGALETRVPLKPFLRARCVRGNSVTLFLVVRKVARGRYISRGRATGGKASEERVRDPHFGRGPYGQRVRSHARRGSK